MARLCPTVKELRAKNHILMSFTEKGAIIAATKSKWSHYPTTRQGDDSESRIQELEKDLKQVKRFVVFHNEYKFSDEVSSDEDDEDDDDGATDVSTHSSMPGLEQIHRADDDASSSNSSSMPELISNDNNSIVSSSTHDSMPSLESVNNSDSDASREKRIRNSAELCGNL